MMNAEESQRWWQRDDLAYRGEELFFADNSVSVLAQRFGSPAFVYSFARVRDNLERVHAALRDANLPVGYTLLYAMKANRFAPLLTSLQHTGLCGDRLPRDVPARTLGQWAHLSDFHGTSP